MCVCFVVVCRGVVARVAHKQQVWSAVALNLHFSDGSAVEYLCCLILRPRHTQ